MFEIMKLIFQYLVLILKQNRMLEPFTLKLNKFIQDVLNYEHNRFYKEINVL
jgi:hypothetical protein